MVYFSLATQGNQELNVNHVIVKADLGRPLHRVALRRLGDIVHIVRADLVADEAAGRIGAVGFTASDVFRWDAALYAELDRVWNEQGDVSAIWQRAVAL